jgi:hypothetical protein
MAVAAGRTDPGVSGRPDSAVPFCARRVAVGTSTPLRRGYARRRAACSDEIHAFSSYARDSMEIHASHAPKITINPPSTTERDRSPLGLRKRAGSASFDTAQDGALE